MDESYISLGLGACRLQKPEPILQLKRSTFSNFLEFIIHDKCNDRHPYVLSIKRSFSVAVI
jgi:hypothetical protein